MICPKPHRINKIKTLSVAEGLCFGFVCQVNWLTIESVVRHKWSTQMITFVRTGDIQDGKAMQAIEWAVKISAYINETFETNISVQQNVAGQINQLHWVSTFESLGDFEVLMGKLMEDADYQQLIAESGEKGLFSANSLVDSFYRTIT